MLISPCQNLRELCRAQLSIKAFSRSRKAAEVFIDVPGWIQAPREAGGTALAAIVAWRFLSWIFVS
jgi:hypothetical protein